MNLLIPFFVGGSLISLIIYLSKNVNTTTAAILYSYPLIYVLSILFMKDSPELVKKFAIEAIPAGISIALFLFLYPFVAHHIKNPILSLLVATAVWVFIALFIFWIFWKIKL
jgi:hypothetical protein